MNDLRQRVLDSLHVARANGFNMQDWTVDAVAIDMVDYNPDFECFSDHPESLHPYICEWQNERMKNDRL